MRLYILFVNGATHMMPWNQKDRPCPNRVLIIAQPSARSASVVASGAAHALNGSMWATRFCSNDSEDELGLGCVIHFADDLETVMELMGSHDRIIYLTSPNYGFLRLNETTSEEYNKAVALHSFCIALSTASDKCHVVHIANSRQIAISKVVDIITENWNV